MNRPKDPETTPETEDHATPAEEAGTGTGHADSDAASPGDEAGRSATTEAGARRDDDEDVASDDPAYEVDDTSGDEVRAPGEETAAEVAEPETVAEHREVEAAREIDTREALEDEHHDEHHDEGMGVAGRLLTVLVIALVAGIGALWAAPKLAPHVPEGVAKYLVPGQQDTAARLAGLSESLAAAEGRIAEVEARLADTAGTGAVSGVAEAVSSLETLAADLQGRLAEVEAQTAALDERMAEMAAAEPAAPAPAEPSEPAEPAAPASVVSDLEALGARVDELAAAVAAGPEGMETLRADVSDLQSRLDAVTERLAGLEGQIGDAGGEIAALAERIGEVEAGREAEIAELEATMRASALERAVTDLVEAAESGSAFGAELAEVERISGEAPPEALTAAAATGAPSTEALSRSLSEPARSAIATEIQSEAGEGAVGQIGAWLRSQVVVRPTTAQDGDSVPAIISRIGARLDAGDAPGAAAEAEALPEPARRAMSGWLERLSARAAVDTALANWTAALGAKG